MWYKHTKNNYSAIKKEWSCLHATAWMILRRVCWEKESRHKRPHIVRFHSHEMSKRGKSIETERRRVVSGGGDLGEDGEGLLMDVGWWEHWGPRLRWWLNTAVYITEATECTDGISEVRDMWTVSQEKMGGSLPMVLVCSAQKGI